MTDMIDYRPIRTRLEERKDELVNGFTRLNKDEQAQVDHIDSLLSQYDNILEDLEADGGLAANHKALDAISTQSVQLLLDCSVIDQVDSMDLLEPITFAEIEGEDEDIDPDEDGDDD